MDFPTTDYILAEFGIEPVEQEAEIALSSYCVISKEGDLKLNFSFSEVFRSFQVRLCIDGREIMDFTSENVHRIEIYRDNIGEGIRAIFEIQGVKAECVVRLNPDIQCRWWLLSAE
ncbi:hypothetical protein LJ656_23790 [Paraburkholderia sp. MMS20-SJTR3]|uniref:Immunity protein 50 n=1 Tax=Paraburkholderia sejongensis TaxID=2886946 RepID=A0ABS8K0C5_9BURK|nr:hypothetical protein [Paraburkholderia sp. MMS20-SJTR3]MCC8395607.1 hypothetical protein [Paraburkholderia sp. MMS20-SJTR3]